MDFATCRYLIRSDVYRYFGRYNFGVLLRTLLVGVGAKYSVWLRLLQYCHDKRRFWPLAMFGRIMLRHYMIKFGIGISFRGQIGPGLYIGHFGGVIVSSQAKIGANCNLSQDVTIGVSRRGSNQGAPTVGDNVYFGPGSRVFGAVTIGNNVAVGANCVVTKDVPADAVVVGVPAKVISHQGSAGYINHTDY